MSSPSESEKYVPTIGILYNPASDRGTCLRFALDRMEPMRPVVDRAVLQLVSSSAFTGADFLIQPDGVCRLNPELARRVAEFSMEQ